MEERNRSCTMPLAANKQDALTGVILAPILIAFLGLVEYWQISDKGWSEASIRDWMVFFIVLFGIGYLITLCEFLAKLHFTPEGISVTLFGFTIRQFPAERIRLLGGITYSTGTRRGHSWHYKIAVCDRSLEELADIGEQKTPKMLRNSRSLRGWTEDMAGKYLRKRAASLFRHFDRSSRMMLLEWAPERAEILQHLYPHARWIDLTEHKMFDKELSQR